MVRSLLLLSLGLLLGGCQSEQFRSQNLGAVPYQLAYQAGLDVLQKYYMIDSANSRTGRITSQPKLVEARRTRAIYVGPAREKAVLRIRQEGPIVWADVRIEVQSQEGEAYASLSQLTSNNDIPNQTPAQRDAALSAEQKQAWVTTGNNYETERRILSDIYQHLHPTSQPASGGPAAP